MELPKKGNKSKNFDDLLQLRCSFHPDSKHITAQCKQLKESGLVLENNTGNPKDKDDKDQGDKGNGGNSRFLKE